jgi:hypothetical protein
MYLGQGQLNYGYFLMRASNSFNTSGTYYKTGGIDCPPSMNLNRGLSTNKLSKCGFSAF